VLALAPISQHVQGGGVDNHQAGERYLVAERHRQRHQAAEGMTDEMRAAARPANDRFQYFGLVRNGRIAGGAALGGSPVAEEARRHVAKPAVQGGNHGLPRGAGAARSRDQHNGRTAPALFVIDAATRVLDHPVNP
jgi:hypothetical protein